MPAMFTPITELAAATLAFVLGHFLLSSQALRVPLTERLGAGGFRAFYSVFVLAAFVWLVTSYRVAPHVELWLPPPWTHWLALLLMPLACILAVGGVTQASPTLVGGESAARDEAATNPAAGFLSITRHPFLCGTALWALLHLAANGDLASTILNGGILALSLGGMAHIDLRRAATLGGAWGPIAMTTSRVPLLAVLQGRCRLDLRGIGLWRPLAGLALYGLLLFLHGPLLGAPLI